MQFYFVFAASHNLTQVWIHMNSNTFSNVTQLNVNFFEIDNQGQDLFCYTNFTSNTYDTLFLDTSDVSSGIF